MKLSPILISTARWTLLAVASVVTLAAVVTVVENWRGDRAWRACEREANARGESLGFAPFATPPVPEERNFFKSPVLESLVYSRADEAPAARILQSSRFNTVDGAIAGGTDKELEPIRRRLRQANLLSGPDSANAAADILAAMQPVAALLDATREAARERPDAWLPFKDPTKGRLPEVGTLFNLGRMLAFRARLEVILHRGDEAFGDLQAVLRLAAGMRSGSKTLLQCMGGEALYGVNAQALEAGCRQHLWTETQLRALQAEYSRHASVAALQETLRVERAWTLAYLDSFDDPAMQKQRPEELWWFRRGWAQQNKVAIFRFMDAALATLDPAAGVLRPDKLEALRAETATLKASRGPYRYFARITTARLDSIIPGFGQSANATTQLLAMIALERHRLAHGDYPGTLPELAVTPAPRALRDAIGGEPLGYARLSADNYSLSHLMEDGRTRATWTLQPGR